jgi:hypothetical protein
MRPKTEDKGEYSVCVYMALTTSRKSATARWVVGDPRSSRGSSKDRRPATGPRDATYRRPLRRKEKASNLPRSPTPSVSQQSSNSSQYSEAQVPMTAIWNPIRAIPSRRGSLEQSDPLPNSETSPPPPTKASATTKSVSFNLSAPQTSSTTVRQGRPRTGPESAAGAAYRKLGKPSPLFDPAAPCSGFWTSASRKAAFTKKGQSTIRSHFFLTSKDPSKPTCAESRQWFRRSTAAIPTDIDTQQGITTVPETPKAALQNRRGRTGHLEAGTMRGRQGRQGRYLRAETLRKERQGRFWR